MINDGLPRYLYVDDSTSKIMIDLNVRIKQKKKPNTFGLGDMVMVIGFLRKSDNDTFLIVTHIFDKGNDHNSETIWYLEVININSRIYNVF